MVQRASRIWGNYVYSCNVPVNSKTTHAPPRANPQAFDCFEKFWSNSPLCWQFRGSNAPPVRASKSVKSPKSNLCLLWWRQWMVKAPQRYLDQPPFRHIQWRSQPPPLLKSQVFLFLMQIKFDEYKQCMSSLVIFFAFYMSQWLIKIVKSFLILFYLQ